LSAFADRKVDEDISKRLGLNHQGSNAVDNLISSSHISFNVPIFLSLVLSFVGTIAVARSVQTIYERSFDLPRSSHDGTSPGAASGSQASQACSFSTW